MRNLKDNKKLLIIIGCAIVIVIAIGCIVGFLLKGSKRNDNPNTDNSNTNEPNVQEINKSAEISNFVFTATHVTFVNGTSEFESTIKNVASEPKYLNEFSINITNQNGEVIKVFGIVDKELAPQEEVTINSSYGGDLSNYSDLEYVIEQ